MTSRMVVPVLELRVVEHAERTIEGIVVPWNETSYVATSDPAGERFLPGSLSRSIDERGDRVKLFAGHDYAKVVGRATGWDAEHPRGLWGAFWIRNGPEGDQVLADVADGMTDSFSVGFRSVQHRRGEDGAREIVEAALYEVSVLPIGAYDSARVLAVRRPAAPRELPPMPAVNLDPIPLVPRAP